MRQRSRRLPASLRKGEALKNGSEIIGNHTKVKVVKNFANIKVQVVKNFPDLKVKKVSNFPNKVGEWQFVENFPDFTIQYVDNFPDIKIQFVDNFPGVP